MTNHDNGHVIGLAHHAAAAAREHHVHRAARLRDDERLDGVLPRAHALRQRQGTTARMEIQPGYAAVLNLATAAPSR